MSAAKGVGWHAQFVRDTCRRGMERVYRDLTSAYLEFLGPPEFRDVWDRLSSVAGFTMDRAESLCLYSLAASRGGTVVEVGSYLGRSTAFLAAGVRKAGTGRVIAIDPHRGGTGDPDSQSAAGEVSTLPLMSHNLRRVGLADFVTPVVGTPPEVTGSWAYGEVSLLFVDGLHTADALTSDITAMLPHLAADAVVVVDDVHSYEMAFTPEFPEVGRTLKTLVRAGALPSDRVRVNTYAVFGRRSLRSVVA